MYNIYWYLQVSARDPDEGPNAELHFKIVAGNEEGLFGIDSATGVLYPNASFLGLSAHR